MVQQRIKIFNGRIITEDRILQRGSLLITGDTISAVTEDKISFDDVDEIDAKGNYISPGYYSAIKNFYALLYH